MLLFVPLKQCKYNLFKWESKNQTNIFSKRKPFFYLIVFASSNLFKLFSYLIQFCVVFLNFFALPFFNRKKIVENLFICKNQTFSLANIRVCTLIFYNLKEVIDFVGKGLPMTGNYNSTYTLFFQH